MATTNLRSNSSAISAATIKRLAAMQDWPLLSTRARTPVVTALSISALGITDECVAASQFQYDLL